MSKENTNRKKSDSYKTNSEVKKEAELFEKHVGRVIGKYADRDPRSQAQISRDIGLSSGYLNKIIKANVTANSFLLYKVMKELKIPSDKLFVLKEDEKVEQVKIQRYMSLVQHAINENIEPDTLASMIDMAISMKK